MSSPFINLEDFQQAADGPTEGAIYTFAQAPTINNLVLLVAIGLFTGFIVKLYSNHGQLRLSNISQSNQRLSRSQGRSARAKRCKRIRSW